MATALYRKYRSQTFGDVCGQDHITSVLKYAAANDRLSHAYLFCGSRGVGKTSCARILAKAVNCENPHDGEPCGVCDSCRSIDEGLATDVVEIDAASNNRVDNIRDICDEVMYTPSILKKRVYIIDEVHMLSASAFNALLKTLEEPPAHAMFILATTELHKLPVTIISRCQRFDFRRIPTDVIADRLRYVASKESITITDEAADAIARQAQGGMRDALSFLDLCWGGGAEVTLDRVRELLGLSGYDTVAATACAVAAHDIAKLFGAVAAVEESSKDISVFISELTRFYRDMLVAKNMPDFAHYLDLTATEAALLGDAADRFNLKTLVFHCRVLDDCAYSMMRSPQTKRIAAEFALVKMCTPTLDMNSDALLARIGELEDKVTLLEIHGVRASGGTGETKITVMDSNDADAANDSVIEDTPDNAVDDASDAEVNAADAKPDVKVTASTDDYITLPDISEALTRLAKSNAALTGFMTDCTSLASPDGSRLIIRVTNSFAAHMLDNDASKRAVSDAFAMAKITAGAAEVTVETAPAPKKGASAFDDLFGGG